MDETELFRQYRETGDPALRDELVSRYLYVASVVAKKFIGRGVEYDDLYQIASLALVKGLDRFDERKGIKFSTFITPTIAGEIKNYFRDRSRLIHLPRRVSELRMRIKQEADRILSETGKSPSPEQLSRLLSVTEEEIVTAMESGTVVSLDRPSEDEEGGSFYDVLPAADDSLERLEQRDVVKRALECLDEREREIVTCRFFRELSQMETAKRMNVSQMYVSRMERKILEKLKENLRKSMAD